MRRNELLALLATCGAGCAVAVTLLGGVTLDGAGDVLTHYWLAWLLVIAAVFAAATVLSLRRGATY